MKTRGKVMILDDDVQVAAGMQALLELEGVDVVTTTSPFDLPFLLGREAPDVLLLDIGMPALAGDQVLRHIAPRLLKRTAVVLFSGRPRRELAAMAESIGAADCLTKEDDLNVITSRIAFWIARSRDERRSDA